MSILVKGGAGTFLDLSDTPNSYSGQSGEIIRVNSAENALELIILQDDVGLEFVVDGEGQAITTGLKGFVTVAADCVIEECWLMADPDNPGDVVVDIWRGLAGSYPPTDAGSITGGNEPEISSGDFLRDTTLTNWTKSLSKNDILGFNIDSCDTITWLTIVLLVAVSRTS